MSDIFHAVQRLGAWVRDYGGDKNPEFIADLKVLLGLGEAAIRNESDVPLDEEWLRSVGGKNHGTATIWFASAEAGPVYELGICLEGGCDGCSIRQTVGSGLVLVVNVLMPLARGEFRRLCAALGIPLSEPSP